MSRLAWVLALLLAGCSSGPVLGNGRLVASTAMVEDGFQTYAGWQEGGREVNLQLAYSHRFDTAHRCSGLFLELYQRGADAWRVGDWVGVAGAGRHEFSRVEFHQGPQNQKITALVTPAALTALVAGGHLVVGDETYRLDDSVRRALRGLAEAYRAHCLEKVLAP